MGTARTRCVEMGSCSSWQSSPLPWEGSRWSARSAARTNDLDADEQRHRLSAREGIHPCPRCASPRVHSGCRPTAPWDPGNPRGPPRTQIPLTSSSKQTAAGVSAFPPCLTRGNASADEMAADHAPAARSRTTGTRTRRGRRPTPATSRQRRVATLTLATLLRAAPTGPRDPSVGGRGASAT